MYRRIASGLVRKTHTHTHRPSPPIFKHAWPYHDHHSSRAAFIWKYLNPGTSLCVFPIAHACAHSCVRTYIHTHTHTSEPSHILLCDFISCDPPPPPLFLRGQSSPIKAHRVVPCLTKDNPVDHPPPPSLLLLRLLSSPKSRLWPCFTNHCAYVFNLCHNTPSEVFCDRHKSHV